MPDDDDSSNASTTSKAVLKGTVIQEAITLPSPEKLFEITWKLISGFIKTELADEQNARVITQEIHSYVKVALGMLPIPVLGLFVDAVMNLVIPLLGAYIHRPKVYAGPPSKR